MLHGCDVREVFWLDLSYRQTKPTDPVAGRCGPFPSRTDAEIAQQAMTNDPNVIVAQIVQEL
jgi:hypothetical protein